MNPTGLGRNGRKASANANVTQRAREPDVPERKETIVALIVTVMLLRSVRERREKRVSDVAKKLERRKISLARNNEPRSCLRKLYRHLSRTRIIIASRVVVVVVVVAVAVAAVVAARPLLKEERGSCLRLIVIGPDQRAGRSLAAGRVQDQLKAVLDPKADLGPRADLDQRVDPDPRPDLDLRVDPDPRADLDLRVDPGPRADLDLKVDRGLKAALDLNPGRDPKAVLDLRADLDLRVDLDLKVVPDLRVRLDRGPGLKAVRDRNQRAHRDQEAVPDLDPIRNLDQSLGPRDLLHRNLGSLFRRVKTKLRCICVNIIYSYGKTVIFFQIDNYIKNLSFN